MAGEPSEFEGEVYYADPTPAAIARPRCEQLRIQGAHDEELQYHVRKMREIGVEVVACKACADTYGVTKQLESLGIDVKYMGLPLTEMLKDGWKTLTV